MSIPDKTSPSHNFLQNRFKKKIPIVLFTVLLLLILALTAALYQLPYTEDDHFQKFTREMFLSEITGNTLNLHYTLANPSAYGIKDYPISLGTVSRDAHLASVAITENYLNKLSNFVRENLSPENQLTYDILLDYLKTSQKGASFYLYDEPLSPTLGIQAQLPILLAEYTFRTKQDIEDYLALLTQVPAYFESIVVFEKEKAQSGLFMSDSCAKDILRQCNSFVKSGQENYLKQIFDDQIDSFTNLTADEKISYKQQNAEILSAYVLPAYENLMSQLAKLLGSGKNDKGLCYLPEGKEYYEYLVHSTTGDSSGIISIESRIKEEIIRTSEGIQSLLQPDSGLTSTSLEGFALPEPEETLEQLQQITAKDFPTPPSVECSVKYVHDSLEDYLSPAFYMIPPIDDIENNVIYINQGSDYNALELYTTLAHEGYPGHLYQTVTFESKNQEPLRSILNFGGYVEGWATYVEMYAYNTWEEDPLLASLYQQNRSLMLGISSLLDIGIHYHGYNRTEVANFLSNFGITEETSNSLYNNILESPANYLKYYVGYLNFQDLQTHLRDTLGDQFSLKEYHARVLNIGPCSFSILKQYLTDSDYLQAIAKNF